MATETMGLDYQGLKPGGASHDRYVSEIVERERYLRDKLQGVFNDMVRWHRLYLADIEDPRGASEKWRACVHVPRAYGAIEALVSAELDILASTDPPIQCGPTGFDDVLAAKGAEELANLTLDLNRWRLLTDMILREKRVQGTALFRSAWRTEWKDILLSPLSTDGASYKASLAKFLDEAEKSGYHAPPAPDEVGFFDWILKASEDLKIPAPQDPFNEKVTTATFNAPKIERLSIFDTRFDPTIEYIQDQPLFIIRSFRTEKWLKHMVDRGVFDGEAVQYAIDKGGSIDGRQENLSEQDKQIAEVMKISRTEAAADPYLLKAHTVWESFMPEEELKHCIVVNGCAIVNKQPTEMPYAHGEIPVTQLRNVPVAGLFCGISEIQQPERMYLELNAHHNLMLDFQMLNAMPVFKRIRSGGMQSQALQIRPGATWDVDRSDSIARAWEPANLGPFLEIFNHLSREIDESGSSGANMRGAPATVGRVSATESQGRLGQAMGRATASAIRTEEEMVPAIRQWLMLWSQFTDYTTRKDIAKTNIGNDQLLAALQYDIRFRGATRTVRRDLLVQQMTTFAKEFRDLIPRPQMLEIGKRVWEAMGLKGGDLVIPQEQIEFESKVEAFKKAQALAQMEAPPPPPPGAGGPPPGEMSPPPGGGEPPPPPMPGPMPGGPPMGPPPTEPVMGGGVM
jgi:hypothetical protein